MFILQTRRLLSYFLVCGTLHHVKKLKKCIQLEILIEQAKSDFNEGTSSLMKTSLCLQLCIIYTHAYMHTSIFVSAILASARLSRVLSLDCLSLGV